MTSFSIPFSLAAIALVSHCHAAEWDAYSYPNPITAYGRCGMDSSSYICDPDGVLTKEERNNVNNQLRQIEMRTRQDGNSDMCTAKGVTPVIVLVRRARGSIHDMIPALLNKWNLDNTCKKDFIIGYATESRDYHVSRNDRGPLTSDELKQVFLSQKTLLKNRQYGPALEGFARQYISKFESMRGPSVGVVKTTNTPYYYDFTSRPSLYMTLTLTLLTLAFV